MTVIRWTKQDTEERESFRWQLSREVADTGVGYARLGGTRSAEMKMFGWPDGRNETGLGPRYHEPVETRMSWLTPQEKQTLMNQLVADFIYGAAYGKDMGYRREWLNAGLSSSQKHKLQQQVKRYEQLIEQQARRHTHVDPRQMRTELETIQRNFQYALSLIMVRY